MPSTPPSLVPGLGLGSRAADDGDAHPSPDDSATEAQNEPNLMDLSIAADFVHGTVEPQDHEDATRPQSDDFDDEWKSKIMQIDFNQQQEIVHRRVFTKDALRTLKSFTKKSADLSELTSLTDKRALEALTGNAVNSERSAVNTDAIEAIRMVHTTMQEDLSGLRTRQEYDRQRIDDKFDRLAASNAYELKALKKHFGDQLVRLQEADNVLRGRLEGVIDRQDLMESVLAALPQRVLAALPQKHHMLFGGLAMVVLMYILIHLTRD
ncbi:hypothetical protein CGCS363_v010261 [Colletotrichum siamense]|uniref:uncharacterized protein n=1 Tax=Colletotrichum siamense TaxID=690259 RepID=UPI001872E9FC|nr:uncharacterized protein CGCS363_v010261 [Colletotrichum siamense]KAF5494536.1 hypothetical protein CGCS363_v010261 [Colletotrichum siamense]